MGLSRPMKWVLFLMQTENVSIERFLRTYRFYPWLQSTKAHPSRVTVRALENKGYIVLERRGERNLWVLTDSGRRQPVIKEKA